MEVSRLGWVVATVWHVSYRLDEDEGGHLGYLKALRSLLHTPQRNTHTRHMTSQNTDPAYMRTSSPWVSNFLALSGVCTPNQSINGLVSGCVVPRWCRRRP